MTFKHWLSVLSFTTFSLGTFAQQDQGNFVSPQNDFYNQILDKLSTTSATATKALEFKANPPANIPKNLEEFNKAWCMPTLSQGRTGTCWCFSTMSFLESEIYREQGKEIKLSEAFLVYHEYVEKAKRFVNSRGNTFLGEGSETNAPTRLIAKYGLVPASAYSGKPNQDLPHDHEALFIEFERYLLSVKAQGAWNEDAVVATVKAILNSHMGAPPTDFEFEGRKYTPMLFNDQITKIHDENYVHFMSLMEQPFYSKALYNVPDNWWRSEDYINVPLDVFMSLLKQSVKQGFTLAIGGDVSEPGYLPAHDVAYVPNFDISSKDINDFSRQLRFTQGVTTDDHAIHLVGYKEDKNGWWFLIKDSGSGSFNGKHKGYYFYHEDYVKLKTMTYTVHKSAVKDFISKYNF